MTATTRTMRGGWSAREQDMATRAPHRWLTLREAVCIVVGGALLSWAVVVGIDDFSAWLWAWLVRG